MEDLGSVFQDEDAAGAQRSGGGRNLDGSEVPAGAGTYHSVLVNYCYYMLLTIPDYFEDC